MPCGKSPQIRHGQIGNLRHVRIRIRAGLKINFDQAHAGHGTRFHVVDAAAESEKSLERVGDVRFDLLAAACRYKKWPPARREY